MKITTERLELIASTNELAQAEINDRERFAHLLGADVPGDWPPPLNDAASMQYNADRLQEAPEQAGWGVWYFLTQDASPAESLTSESPTARQVLIGIGGFKGPPSAAGEVEIGYSLMEPYQGAVYGTEAAAGLVRWAFAHPEVTCVIAETLPELTASIRVLEKNHFTFVGAGSEESVIRYRLSRQDYARHAGNMTPVIAELIQATGQLDQPGQP